MSDSSLFGLNSSRGVRPDGVKIEQVLIQRPLQKLLAFRGRTIDDVVNERFVKNEIYGYWKLDKQVRRTIEVVDLERQWNAPAVVRKRA